MEKLNLKSPTIDPKAVVLFQKSIVHNLYETSIELPDGQIAKNFCNDVTLLLDQKRLNGLGADTIKAYFEKLTPLNDSLSELRKKVSDDDLISVIKSKYIQSPSELTAWISSLDENAQSVLESVQQLQQSQDPKQNDTETSVEQNATETSVASNVNTSSE